MKTDKTKDATMHAISSAGQAARLRRTEFRRKVLPALIASCFACGPAFANPSGAQVVSGQAVISSSGNVLNITNTPGAIINWQSFSINPGELTQFLQQSSNSSVLNRIVGQDPSQIFGTLQSNGKVYLINPNGILFGAGSRVNVGGLVASSLDIANGDFTAGKLNFSAAASGQAGAVSNQGNITTPSGGQVYLIAPQVQNSGIINSPQGEVLLAAGHSVQLIDGGDPNMQVVISSPTDQALNLGSVVAQSGKIGIYGALVNQNGLVSADSAVLGANGQIVFKSSQSTTLAGNSVTSAQGAGSGGSVYVLGPQVALADSAQINASGQTGGGTVLVGGDFHGANPAIMNANTVTLGANTSIKADAIQSGNGGNIAVWSANSTSVAGSISAQGGAQSGNGGYIETSGAQLTVANSAAVSTAAAMGLTGTWLLDPVNFTIAASGGDITGAALSSDLASNSVLIDTASSGSNTGSHLYGASGTSGNIYVNDTVSWSANTLTLSAQNNIYINSTMTGTGTAGLSLLYGQQSAGGGTSNYYVNAPVNLASSGSFQTQLGSSGSPVSYTIITSLGNASDETEPSHFTLAGMAYGINQLGSGVNFVLGSNIDASATSTWNSGGGFVPLGNNSYPFNNIFDGLGHTISGLTINSSANYQGLFGYMTSTAVVRNVGLTGVVIVAGGTVTGNYVGGLVGYNNGGIISNSSVAGSITGIDEVGGLVGYSAGGTISSSSSGTASGTFFAGTVSGANFVGGLVGDSQGATISNSYASGLVSGQAYIGGLVGLSSGGSDISSSFAMAAVSASGNFVGGLVGSSPDGTISNSFAIGSVSGSDYVGGLVGISGATISSTTSGTASGTFFTGTVSGTYFVGGLVGGTEGGTISNSFASGPVSGETYIGGLVGLNSGGSDISSSFAITGVSASGNYVGGLVGSGSGGTISNSFATGTVSGINDVGGLVGVSSNSTISSTISGTASGTYFLGAVSGTDDVGGLVGRSAETTISNSKAAGPVSGTEDVGGLVGYSSGGSNISSSFAIASVTASGNYVGGLVGAQYGGTVSASYAVVNVSGASQTGGLVGINNGGTVTGSYAVGTVAGTCYVGGLVGENSGGSGGGDIINSYAAVKVTGTNNEVGGLVGYLVGPCCEESGGTITGSFATGSVSGVNYVGGLVGLSSGGGDILKSFATGTVSGTSYVGGLVGENYSATIGNTYTTGTVSGTSDVGGLVGAQQSGDIYTSYAAASVSGSSNTGGLVGGSSGGTISNSYWDTTVSGQTSSGGSGATGLVTTQMKPTSNSSNNYYVTNGSWDFTTVWTVPSGSGYPTLRGVTPTPTPTPTPAPTPAPVVTIDLTVSGESAANKVYDGTTSASLSGGSLVGVAPGDSVTLVQSGSFASKNVGSGIAVNVSDSLSIGGDASGDIYVLVQPTGVSANITPLALTVTGQSAANKVYNGTTAAIVSGGSLVGVLAGDDVSLAAATSGSFATKNVGSNIAVTVQDGLNGADSGNYTLTQPTALAASITPASLSITGQTASNKVYDGTTTAFLTGGSMSGLVAGDVVTVSETGTFASKNVGTNIPVTIQDKVGGPDAGNYTLTQPTATLTANITPLALTVAATGSNKVFDGTTTDTVSLSAVGVLPGDNVSFADTSASFASATVGTGKAVTVSGITASGANASDYSFNSSAVTSANITPASLSVVGEIAQNKVYDGTTSATLVGGSLSGTVTGFGNVVLTQSGNFANSTVGNGVVVIASDSVSGSDAGNYTLVQPAGLTANIVGATTVTQATPTLIASNSYIIAINTEAPSLLTGGTQSTVSSGGSSSSGGGSSSSSTTGSGNPGSTGGNTNNSGATTNGNVKKLYCN